MVYEGFLPAKVCQNYSPEEAARRMRLLGGGFSWSALSFGPFWLAAKGAWLFALLWILIWFLVGALISALSLPPILFFWTFVLLQLAGGFCGRDGLRLHAHWRGDLSLGLFAGGESEAENHFLSCLNDLKLGKPEPIDQAPLSLPPTTDPNDPWVKARQGITE